MLSAETMSIYLFVHVFYPHNDLAIFPKSHKFQILIHVAVILLNNKARFFQFPIKSFEFESKVRLRHFPVVKLALIAFGCFFLY